MSKFIEAASAAIALALSMGAASAQTPEAAPPAAVQASHSDAQLRSFAAASLEIDPISRALPTANAEQRTAATAQIRDILQRHSIDSATYNAIAAQAQTDAALAQRIASLQTEGSHTAHAHDGTSAHGAPTTEPTTPAVPPG